MERVEGSIGFYSRVRSVNCFSGILVTLLLVSCVRHEAGKVEQEVCFPRKEIEVKYAKGFRVESTADYTKIITCSFSENDNFQDSVYLLHRHKKLPGGAKVISPDADNFACQSSTHLAYIDELGALDLVMGLCGLMYISDPEVKKILESNGTQELCAGEQVNMEELLKVSPDLFFIYPFGKTYERKFAEHGVKTLLIAEYLEESQLARLEWIKLFGLLLGKADEANAYFEQVEHEYNSLKMPEQDTNKRFIMNVPFGDTWFMPSSRSVGVRLIEDAGLCYFYSDEAGTENISRAKEVVWSDGIEANYWIIIAERPAGFSLDDLIAEEPVYKEFKSVIHQQVLFCNTAEVDYFAKGVVEPNIILKDLLYLTHQISEHQPKYFVRLE